MTDSERYALTGESRENSHLTQIGVLKAGVVHLGIPPEQVGELLAAMGSAGTASEAVGALAESQPPKPVEHWQGRAAELEQLRQWLLAERPRAIGIVGIGGVGKSSLVARLIEEPEIVEAYPQRFWADVGMGASFASLARQVLAAFGATVPEDEQHLGGALLNCLRERPRLLVLDNLESLLRAGDRGFVSPFYEDFLRCWLEYGRTGALLVTTRERPELREFNCWQPLTGLRAEEGAALLTDYGIGGDVRGLAVRADGYPLLLTLVAKLLLDEYPAEPHLDRLGDLGLAGLADWLDRVEGQHRTETVAVAAVLAASVARANAVQRRLFLQASVYRGEFAAAAAAALVPDVDPMTVERELRRLARRSLLGERSEGGKRWFGFQPLVLEYARYVAGDLSEAHRRAIAFYRQQTQPREAWQSLADVQADLEIFHHYCELENWGAAFDAIRGNGNVSNFLDLRGYYQTEIELYQRLEEHWPKATRKTDRRYRACLTSLGSAFFSLGQTQRAIKFHQQSLDIAREISDRRGEANSLGNLGNVYHSLGQYQRAIEFYQQWLEIACEIVDRHGEAGSLNGLGSAYYSLGQYQRAIEFHQQSLEIKREISDRQGEAKSFGNLGSAYSSLGQYQRAIEFHQQSLNIAREIKDRSWEGGSLSNLGAAYKNLGEYQRAIEYYEAALTVLQEIGHRQFEANTLSGLGNAYYSLGQYQRAIEFHQQSLEIGREIGDRQGEANSLGNLGNAYDSLGQYQRAIEFHQQSLEIRREIGDRSGEGASLCNLGSAYENLGEYQQAIEYYEAALTVLQEIGHRQFEANTLSGLGNAYDSLGQYQRAIEFYQQSAAIYRQIQQSQKESVSLNNLIKAHTTLKQWQPAIECYERLIEIQTASDNRQGKAQSMLAIAAIYQQQGKIKAAWTLQQQANQLLMETGGLDALPVPKWLKSTVKFAQRSKFNLALCFLLGLVAFPFALIWIVALLLYRLLRAPFRRR